MRLGTLSWEKAVESARGGGRLLPNSRPCHAVELVHIETGRLAFPAAAHRDVIAIG